MNHDEYKEHLAALDALRPLAEQIAKRLCPWARSAGVEDFDNDSVTMICFWPNYETETIAFPATWLFDPEWEQRVNERLESERLAADAKKQKRVTDLEAEERQQLERLQAKYSELKG